MKYILTLTTLLILAVCFSSCERDYTCYCEDQTKVNGELRTKNDRKFNIRAQKKDAENQCVYYETEELYLNDPAIVYHYCKLD